MCIYIRIIDCHFIILVIVSAAIKTLKFNRLCNIIFQNNTPSLTKDVTILSKLEEIKYTRDLFPGYDRVSFHIFLIKLR